jgi:hypothetical protein
VDEGNGDKRRGCDGQHRDQHADVKAFRRTSHRMGGLSRRWKNRYFRVYTGFACPARLPVRDFRRCVRRWQQNPQRFESGLDDDPIAQTLPTAAELTDRAAVPFR